MASNKLTVLKMNGVHNPSVLRSVSPNNNRDISQKFESRSMSPNPYLNVLKKSPVKDGKRTPSPCSNSENEESNGLNPQPRVVSSSMKMNIRSGSPNANDTASLKAKTASPVSDTKSACASINGTRDEPYSRNKTEKDETQNNTQSEQSGKIDTIATKSAVGKTEKSNKDGKQCNMIEATTESTRIVNTSTNGDNKLETQNNATSKKSDTMDSKSARFAKKKKQRAKRYKSDGFMLGLELGANSSDEEGFQLGNNIGDAVNFLQLIRNPNLQNLAKLRRLIKGNDKDWMKEFLEFDGLGLLFQCLKNLSEIQGFHLSDMVLRMECIMCIREVINSQSGLDCLLLIKGRKDNIFGRRFASALETKNLMVKMQIFELLSALCVYSKDGYYLTLDALERYRSWQKLQYRMSVLVNEVRKSELTTYKTTIMALINAIIFANENIRDRVRIRNEFLALSILDTIQTLRCEDDEDLFVQCDVFEEELNADTDALEEAKNGTVNLNDPQSVFTAVHKKVQGTPLNATFLGILHSLLQIEPHNSQSESTWTLIERVTQDALSKDPLSDTDFAQTVIKNHSKETREQEIQTEENNRLSLLGTPSIAFPPPPSGPPSLESSTESTAPVPPPPPPLPSGTAQVPQAPPLPPTAPGVPGVPAPPAVPGIPGAPPPPPAPGVPGVPAPPPAPGVPGAPPPPAPPGVPGAPPPPAPPGVPGAPPPPGAGFQVAAVQPPKTIDTPRPSMKMKTIAWNKIPVNSFKKESVWGKVLDMKDSIDVEYSKFEELFSQKQVVSPAASLSPETAEKGVNRRNSGQNHGEVTLLDPKKSMNINIFLKQFRKTNDAIIELIKAGDVRGLGVEKLKGMLKLLPLQDEADMLQAYDGEVEKLGNAEKFFYSLIQLNGYKLRIETMILKGDFNSQLGSIRPNIQTLSTVCRKLIDNDSLQVFLRFVLHAGNFINGGSSSGGAIGFRISSLNKLVNMKSNQPKMTLLHVLVQEAQQKNKGALEFVSDLLEPLQKASRFTLDGMIGEFSTLKTSVVKIKGQIENASEEVQQQFSSFIQEAESDIKDVDEAIDRVQKLSVRLAVHYCENERSFKLDEFLEAFKEFCEKAKSCEQEIETWRINAEKAELRRQTQAQMMERRKSGNRQGMVQGSDQEKHKIVDNLVNEIRRGKVLRRLSLRRNVTDEEIAASGKK